MSHHNRRRVSVVENEQSRGSKTPQRSDNIGRFRAQVGSQAFGFRSAAVASETAIDGDAAPVVEVSAIHKPGWSHYVDDRAQG